MIDRFLTKQFTLMPWKNGRGTTSQIYIFPEQAKLEQNNFLYRISSAPVQEDGAFSTFPGKMRILVPIQGAGFQLNEQVYEKFEIAYFSGDEKTFCNLLKGPVMDFGLIYDPNKVRISAKILHLKTAFSFALDPSSDYFITVLSGNLLLDGQSLQMLETLRYRDENQCQLTVEKASVLMFMKVDLI